MTRTYHFLASLLVLGVSIALAATPAVAFRGHIFSSTFGAEGSGNGQFKEPSGVAVNEATGQVYVLDQGNSRIEIFDHEGKYLSQFGGSETPEKAFAFGTVALTGGITVDNSCYFKKLSGSACTSADPSNGDVYVTDRGNKVVDKFSAEGAYLGQLEEDCGKAGCPAFRFTGGESPVNPAGVAVDTGGTVWVYYSPEDLPSDVVSFTNSEPSAFVSGRSLESINIQLEHLGSFDCPGFAVDSEDDFYTRRAGNRPECSLLPSVSKFAVSGKALIAPISAEETSAVAVDLSSGEVFLDNVGSVGAFSSGGVLQERFGSGHLTGGTGLAVDHENSTDSTVYVADGVADRVVVFSPEPPGPPLVVGESVSDVTGDSAQLGGEVNPRGSSTHYRFEYGLCATPVTCASSAFGESVPVPDGVVGSDFEVHSVSAALQDLVAGAVYHFRVVAYNEESAPGTVVAGEEGSFRTQPSGVFELPDGRAWEMVSPPSKLGADFYPIGFGMVQAAASGDAVAYLAASPTESGASGNALASQVFSVRGFGGWSSRDINPPHETAVGQPIGNGANEYRFFSDDLSLGVVQRFGAFMPSLSPQASEETPYLRSDFVNGNVGEPCLPASMGCYSPLVSSCPPGGEECAPAVAEHANAAPGSVFGQEGQCPGHRGFCGPVFEGATPDLRHVVLGSEAPLLEAQVKNGLYEWSEGKLVLVSVLPQDEGARAVTGVLGGLVGGSRDARHAISRDGSRVVWATYGTPHLYLYDGGREGSVRLDIGLTGTPEFQTATADASEVFFTENGDLYEYDVEHEQLDRLTEAADVVGSLPGVSEDGSYVYFVANGVVTPGAEPGKCGNGFSIKTECDLYVRHDGTIRLVTVLSSEDNPDWNPSLPGLTARVSPSGRWLAFMSSRSLTGYDNRDALSGKPDEEVYLYDAEHERLVCASCDPSGARPNGIEYGSLSVHSLVGSSVGWERQRFLAANIPGWTTYSLGEALYQSRYLSDSGRLFFNSNEALTPQDVNGTWDVYEYEPPGVGNCGTGAASFSERSGGCVASISSGRSPDESAFIDASETGGDVFFLTAAKLASQDYDTALDVYDAHECTDASPCLPVAPVLPPPCGTGDACKAAPSPQPSIFGAPASATFNGAGNVSSGTAPKVKPKSLTRAQKLARALHACKEKPKRKRSGCVRRARHTYGPVDRAKRSNRRAG
jgi:DNA-binding beta-propeller fold protein YncE